MAETPLTVVLAGASGFLGTHLRAALRSAVTGWCR